MAGKHYGGFLAFDGNLPGTQVYPGRLNRAFMEGWSGQPAVHPVGTPEYTAWQNGNAQAGVNPPTNAGAGRRWETAG